MCVHARTGTHQKDRQTDRDTEAERERHSNSVRLTEFVFLAAPVALALSGRVERRLLPHQMPWASSPTHIPIASCVKPVPPLLYVF